MFAIKLVTAVAIAIGLLSVLWLMFAWAGVGLRGIGAVVRAVVRSIGRLFGAALLVGVLLTGTGTIRNVATANDGYYVAETLCHTRVQYGWGNDRSDNGWLDRQWSVTLCSDLEWKSSTVNLVHSSVNFNTYGPFGVTWNADDCETWDKKLDDGSILIRGRCNVSFHAVGVGFIKLKTKPVWVSMHFAKIDHAQRPEGRYIDYMDSSEVDFFNGEDGELPQPLQLPKENLPSASEVQPFYNHRTNVLNDIERDGGVLRWMWRNIEEMVK